MRVRKTYGKQRADELAILDRYLCAVDREAVKVMTGGKITRIIEAEMMEASSPQRPRSAADSASVKAQFTVAGS